jgi:hypothetical protein
MYEWVMWDLQKQREAHATRLAERARLEREARPSRRAKRTKG